MALGPPRSPETLMNEQLDYLFIAKISSCNTILLGDVVAILAKLAAGLDHPYALIVSEMAQGGISTLLARKSKPLVGRSKSG